jgi:hypothetical protein
VLDDGLICLEIVRLYFFERCCESNKLRGYLAVVANAAVVWQDQNETRWILLVAQQSVGTATQIRVSFIPLKELVEEEERNEHVHPIHMLQICAVISLELA